MYKHKEHNFAINIATHNSPSASTCYSNASLNNWVFSPALNPSRVVHLLKSSCSLFHKEGAHTENDLPPALTSLAILGFSKHLSAERKFLPGSYNSTSYVM